MSATKIIIFCFVEKPRPGKVEAFFDTYCKMSFASLIRVRNVFRK